jgi:adenosylhomocysteine nucleosidase
MHFIKEDVLVVMAMADEGGEHLKKIGANVIYTGLGKVNATYHLTKYLSISKPKLVLNLGTAGSKLFKRGELVAANRFLQRDMDVSPLGFKKFATPFEDTPVFLEFEKVFYDLPNATVGTGDSFETSHNNDSGELVDMEAYALAKICYLEKIQFACVKLVSDGADQNASEDWQEVVAQAPRIFVDLFLRLIKN